MNIFIYDYQKYKAKSTLYKTNINVLSNLHNAVYVFNNILSI